MIKKVTMKSVLTACAAIGVSAVLLQGCKAPVMKVNLEPTEMIYGDDTRTGVPFSKDPTVIRLGDTYYMYYSIAAYSDERRPAEPAYLQDGWNAAIATSHDLIHWTRLGDVDLRDSSGERIWGAVAPCVKVFDGVIHMFYQGRWKKATDSNNNIWHAISEDGATFTNTCDEPILVPHTDWSIDRSIDAEVYKLGRKMMLLFATRDKTGKVQMLGMARAPYGSDYGPDKWTLLSTDGPLLRPDFPWEQHCIEAPTVIEHRGVWYMFYAGAYNHELQQIGLATSRDGYHFERIAPDGLLFPVGEEGTWNHGESGHPGVFRDEDGQVYLFFQGKASSRGNYLLSACKVNFVSE